MAKFLSIHILSPIKNTLTYSHCTLIILLLKPRFKQEKCNFCDPRRKFYSFY
nr:MAG TPA: hypothetical protein [Caudoviricetes sp.]